MYIGISHYIELRLCVFAVFLVDIRKFFLQVPGQRKKKLLSGSIKSDVKISVRFEVLRMCHPRNLVAFCENCFRHNLKTKKHTFLTREFHKESTFIFRILAKNCIFEILAKTVFWPFFFFKEDERNIYGQRNCKNLPTLSTWSKNVYQCYVFSFFYWILMLENLCKVFFYFFSAVCDLFLGAALPCSRGFWSPARFFTYLTSNTLPVINCSHWEHLIPNNLW